MRFPQKAEIAEKTQPITVGRQGGPHADVPLIDRRIVMSAGLLQDVHLHVHFGWRCLISVSTRAPANRRGDSGGRFENKTNVRLMLISGRTQK